MPDTDDEIGWGRFVLLYDPAGQTGWDGPFRIIAYVRADLEPEIAADPLIGQVGWSWLTEALDARAAGYRQTSGTVTRVVTEGFGAKQGEPMATGFELRASWSPADPPRCAPGPATGAQAGPPDLAPPDLGGHVAAWCDALCMAAGLPPLPAGVSPLRPPRSRRRAMTGASGRRQRRTRTPATRSGPATWAASPRRARRCRCSSRGTAFRR